MWRSHHKGQEAEQKLFFRILYVVSIVHIIGLFGAFFVQYQQVMHIRVQPQNVCVVCVPSFMAPSQPAIQKKVSKKQPAQITKNGPKPQPMKKKSPLMPLPNEKRGVIHTTPKQSLKTEKKRKPEPKKKEAPPVIKPEQEKEVPHNPDEIIYVNNDMYQQIQVARAIQISVAQHWSPPLGIPPQTACTVQVEVNGEGKASKATILKGSGIALFDMAARRSLLQASYPPLTQNKTIVIYFNEDFS